MENIKRGLLSLILLSVFVMNVSCVSQPSYFSRGSVNRGSEKIAVLPFRDYNQNEGNNSGELVRTLFESTLLKRGFHIIEVEKAAVAVDYDFLEKNEFPSKWIIDTGEAIGSDFMIYGSVHDYRTYQSSTSFLYLFSWLEITSSVGVTARLVSCKTGEVVWRGTLTCASYTFGDAAAEAVKGLVKTIRYKPAESK